VTWSPPTIEAGLEESGAELLGDPLELSEVLRVSILSLLGVGATTAEVLPEGGGGGAPLTSVFRARLPLRSDATILLLSLLSPVL